jgi:uncharacterized protein (DUF433 family)
VFLARRVEGDGALQEVAGRSEQEVLRLKRVSMEREQLLARISIDPNVCFGKPCIRGHRIWVSLILDMLAGGMTFEEILDSYPGVEYEDILACIAYGAEMSRERYVELPRV